MVSESKTYEYLKTTPTMMTGSVRAWAHRTNRISQAGTQRPLDTSSDDIMNPFPKKKSAVPQYQSKVNTYHH